MVIFQPIEFFVLLAVHNYQVTGPKDRHLAQRCLGYSLISNLRSVGTVGGDGLRPLELSVGPLRVDIRLKSQKVNLGSSNLIGYEKTMSWESGLGSL